jgi:endonuclease-3
MNPRDQALEVHRRLTELYGAHPGQSHLDPISQLVCTVISQNTNDRLRDLAYNTLRCTFPTWEMVRDAPTEAIAGAIQVAGLGKTKAPHIQNALRRITAERGTLELEFLREKSVEEAKAWLTAMKGVGPKTAAIILLFSLGMPAFPVDTHVHRVSRRLGLIPAKTSRDKSHRLLEELLPPETYYTSHLNLIRHGREVCTARKPHCQPFGPGAVPPWQAHAVGLSEGAPWSLPKGKGDPTGGCPLQDLCEHYRTVIAPQA